VQFRYTDEGRLVRTKEQPRLKASKGAEAVKAKPNLEGTKAEAVEKNLQKENRKAEAVRNACEGPISTICPASIVRTHPNASVYLDAASAALLSTLTHG
jgi:hypothetical protein